jgi:hypothetical protein
MASGVCFALLLLGRAAWPSGDIALEKCRKAAWDFQEAVRRHLAVSLRESGPAGAIYTCAYQAQAVASDVAKKQGVSVKRTSLKLRNPANAPDDYERGWLEWFASLRGEKLPDERIELCRENGRLVYRYVSPILVEDLCLSCHGTSDQIPKDVRRVLEANYPGDSATGYAKGELRGLISVVIRSEGKK